jgi:hypothetical protein
MKSATVNMPVMDFIAPEPMYESEGSLANCAPLPQEGQLGSIQPCPPASMTPYQPIRDPL